MSDIQLCLKTMMDGPHSLNAGPSRHQARILQILRHFAGAGLTLERASGPKYLNRSIETLRRYCRKGSIAFPDYTPKKLRPE